MALVTSSQIDHRIYKPSFDCEYPPRKEQSQAKSRLLDKIHSSYRKALERLNVRARPSMAARFLYGGGFCFGLLDPASNIVANTLIPYEHGPTSDRARGEGEEKEEEEEVTAGFIPEAALKDLERRSLDGLVTFLTRFFPYLAECEAVRYLLIAEADALVAARIIVLDRRMKRFGSLEGGRAVEDALTMALKCAALAARHPEPDCLVNAWITISCSHDVAVDLLSRVRRRSPSSSLHNFTSLIASNQLRPQLSCDMWRLWLYASSRCPRRRSVLYQPTTTTPIKRVLLDAIHGFYLQALAWLPTGELRSRFHRSLLKAGHCYGPLDPVSNIIVNTIWYDAAFPPTVELDMDMVSTLSLHRIETRSMYGLVSFLCTRYHHLDFHRAICCLLEADANLLRADPNLGPTGQRKYWATYTIFDAPGLNIISRSDRGDSPWNTTTGFPIGLCSVDALARGPDTSVNEAFKAAAAAAHHPNPDAQANLFASPKALMVLAADQLSSEAVQRIARFLCPEHPYSEQPLPPFPLKEYVSAHTKISKKVNAVLNAYEQMPNGEPKYQLHVICGVNYLVSGPVYCPGGSTFAPHKCYHSHVNFLATSRDTQSQAGEAKVVLFFAELSNDDEDKAGAQSLCCPVWLPPPCAERIRCLYCDYVGARIVHPIQEEFHGRKREFEKMVCGEDPCDDMVCGEDPYVFDPVRIQTYYTNMDAIRHSCLIADEVGCLKEDCLYADSYGLEGHKSDEDGRVIDYMIDEYDVFE